MKRAYLLNGTLTAQLKQFESVIELDSTSTTYLTNLLASDYCYLVIGGKEIVKVTGIVDSKIEVQRTFGELHYWPSGTQVKYQLTPNEIQDASIYVGYSLSATEGMSWVNGVFGYEDLQILGWGGINISGVDGEFIIEDIPQNAGCCGVAAAQIPDQYLLYRVIGDSFTRRITDSGEIRSYQ